ncbi:hypothetical protein MG5_06306 [Candida albicans P57072]|uniref:6-O-methylguanine-DNA methyltransferase n=3 Tax=Candida albicans TaxID=5476 RepID=A0A1D8PU47_CANAL|nr:uncharacterized protein CAALFM_CR10000CA [Candida albicans SC5314]KAF6068684.1 6-O-methylguanine DNA methyltransferase, DNA binding domain family protein [Candida albicans]KGQ80470.1 hypothetical protein MEO_06287 [Candida albicans P94015]KGQ80736.1 hypothetical protein MG1_06358 [Candida albicans GC75]KGQ80924.1 hypothetical protein MEU_06321 [Candida albicans P37005]KGQ99822.1 hypothetical protein MG5_06306 [Candida albicans P57072]KGR00685.1 hypothetical protein MG3_06358 [Candida albic|eukprot:XP_019331122.1 hypothetical protein CAALFM_CR10000CA [Candida albicans SC5314]
MRLTDESKAFHFGVYSIVFQIPYGKVTSYGHIAYLLNKPQNSRQVGSSLKHCSFIISQLNENLDPSNSDWLNVNELPWWRVVSSSGKISPREANGQYIQRDKLLQENVAVSEGHMVDMDEYGWFPEDINY